MQEPPGPGSAPLPGPGGARLQPLRRRKAESQSQQGDRSFPPEPEPELGHSSFSEADWSVSDRSRFIHGSCWKIITINWNKYEKN